MNVLLTCTTAISHNWIFYYFGLKLYINNVSNISAISEASFLLYPIFRKSLISEPQSRVCDPTTFSNTIQSGLLNSGITHHQIYREGHLHLKKKSEFLKCTCINSILSSVGPESTNLYFTCFPVYYEKHSNSRTIVLHSSWKELPKIQI